MQNYDKSFLEKIHKRINKKGQKGRFRIVLFFLCVLLTACEQQAQSGNKAAKPTEVPITVQYVTATPMPDESSPTAAGTLEPTGAPGNQGPSATEAPVPTAVLTPANTPAAKPTSAPTSTPIPVDTPTSAPTAAAEPTGTPTAAPDPTNVPTSVPASEPTAEPTAATMPTSAPTAVPTSTPIPTATPTPITQVDDRAQVASLMQSAKRIPNTNLTGTELLTSEAAANEMMRVNSQKYSEFSILVSDEAYFHTAEGYQKLFSEIETIELKQVELYNNGICVTFTNVKPCYDANLCYAIRTGNTEVLNDTERKVYKEIARVSTELGLKDKSDIEKIKAVHDYLVLNTQYDTVAAMQGEEIAHTPQGTLFNKKAVCDGYARTFRLFLLMNGIDCQIQTGSADGGPHAWDLVNVGGKWYHVDVTWDDPVPDEKGQVMYDYFMQTDAKMKATHAFSGSVVCDDDSYSIYAYRDYYCETIEQAEQLLMEQLLTEQPEKESAVVFCYPKDCGLTQSILVNLVSDKTGKAVRYYPEAAIGNYRILRVENPKMVQEGE